MLMRTLVMLLKYFLDKEIGSVFLSSPTRFLDKILKFY